MSVQEVHLSRTVYRIPPTVRAVQGDTGRTLKMIIDDEELASGMTGVLCFERPDGTEYDAECTLALSDNAFTAPLVQGITQAGRVKAQLSAIQSEAIVSSFLFYIEVQASVSGEITEEEYSTVQDAVTAADAAASAANTAASSANGAASLANTAASDANTAKTAADEAAAAANHAAEVAMTYSGGYIQLVDLRDDAHYRVGLSITTDGYPSITLTEIEED